MLLVLLLVCLVAVFLKWWCCVFLLRCADAEVDVS